MTEATLPDLARLRAQHLAGPDWLADRILARDPAIRIVDMRGYVTTETGSDGAQTAWYAGARDEYLQGHIPGAVFLDWTRDIVDLDDPVPAQVARPGKIARVFGSAGIGDDTLVVAYDAHPAAQFATRLWWVLRYYGHPAVRVLDGGWSRWTQEQRPIETGGAGPPPAVFTPRLQPGWRATAEEMLADLRRDDSVLVDARDEDQYFGRTRRGPRGGHIPGARSLPREALLAGPGAFLAPDGLQAVVSDAGLEPDRRVVAYCNGGVAATSVLFCLSMLGYEHLANYDGSWNEWGGRDDLPVEP